MSAAVKIGSEMADISFDDVWTMADILHGKTKKYGRGFPARLVKSMNEKLAVGDFGEHGTYMAARRELWVVTLAIQYMRNKI